MPKITGRTQTRTRRLIQGLTGSFIIIGLILFLLFSGRLDGIEYRGLDWLQRSFGSSDKASDQIAMLYIDQKSIDFFQRSRGIGWPWPRDAYGLVVQYLQSAGAKAVIFDAVFSEPSVFANDYDDDNTFAAAMEASGRVYQTLTFHQKVKGGAPVDQEALANLKKRGLIYRRESGPKPEEFQDVTMPIMVLERAARGVGFIDIEPEADGVVRRMRLLSGFQDQVYPTLSLAVYLKTHDIKELVQADEGLQVGQAVFPLDSEGKTLIKFYGVKTHYPDYTMAAVIQSGVDLTSGAKPMLDPALFKDKYVYVGAKAAGLFDLRSTPVAKALPGVDIHATILNNLLADDFLRRASVPLRGALLVALVLGTLAAAVLTRSVPAGAILGLGLTGLYVAGTIAAFRNNLWLDLAAPLGGQLAVFILATLVNYYGEGREKKAVRNAFSRYLSPEVVDSVIKNPELLSLGGSRRIMTCFFSDLAGFTSISEALSPEDLVQLLNRYLSLMTRAILARGGTVDKFEGDAIMAFWGAPLIREDHALQACLSALEQQELMATLREEALAEGLPELKVRMGLNTGPMIVGNMGSEERFDYTVMGDAVNLASRLEGANKPYDTYIMISESTYAEVREHVEVRELDLLRVKGKLEPIRVYELLAKSGQLDPRKAETVDLYNQGLAAYRDMDFQRALEYFEKALTLDPGDGPSKTYVERCKTYRADPPPPDWDRVFTMTTK